MPLSKGRAVALAIGFGVVILSSSASAVDRCSPWMAAGEGRGKIELRSCRAGGSSADEPSPTTLEVRSGSTRAKKIRYEVVTADGTAETLDATLHRGVNQAGICSVCLEHGDVQAFHLVDASGASAGVGGAGEAARPVRGNHHLQVLARDLRLGDAQAGRLARIADRYFEATRKRLVVTGGSRPPERQAELMHEKMAHGDDIRALYENQAAAGEILAVYREGVAQRLPRKRLVRTIRDRIEAQVSQGVYISKHLKAGAVDVRSWGMHTAQVEALRKAIAAEPGVVLQDERSGAEPHFHVNI